MEGKTSRCLREHRTLYSVPQIMNGKASRPNWLDLAASGGLSMPSFVSEVRWKIGSCKKITGM